MIINNYKKRLLYINYYYCFFIQKYILHVLRTSIIYYKEKLVK